MPAFFAWAFFFSYKRAKHKNLLSREIWQAIRVCKIAFILAFTHTLTNGRNIKIYSIFLKIAGCRGRAPLALRRERNLLSFRSIWSKIYNRRLWRMKGINFGEAVINFKPSEQRRKNLADSESVGATEEPQEGEFAIKIPPLLLLLRRRGSEAEEDVESML